MTFTPTHGLRAFYLSEGGRVFSLPVAGYGPSRNPDDGAYALVPLLDKLEYAADLPRFVGVIGADDNCQTMLALEIQEARRKLPKKPLAEREL